MFRFLRIAVLLTILLIVAGNQWQTENRLSSWEKPLWVTVYPVLADPDASVEQYAQGLSAEMFRDMGLFLKQQAGRYGRELESPVMIQVARPLKLLPPALPAENTGLGVALWSLKMRWWSFRNSGQDGLTAGDVKIFVLYQKERPNRVLERSVGIKNGSYGVVNAIASRQMSARNLIVITHELLHVLGATDKYDMHSGQPDAPDGLASPKRLPLYPQNRAEIMSGRIAVSARQWRLPPSLKSCVIGSMTADEIGWSGQP
jgi:hypothetical protein